MNLPEIFSSNLKRYLSEQNRTQLELSKYLGVSNTTVNNYVKGYNMPRMDKIDKICSFFWNTKNRPNRTTNKRKQTNNRPRTTDHTLQQLQHTRKNNNTHNSQEHLQSIPLFIA